MREKIILSKVHVALIALLLTIFGLLSVIVFILVGSKSKNEPHLTSKDFSTAVVSKSSSPKASGEMSSLDLVNFDLENKSFTGDFGGLTLKAITKITESHDNDRDKDQYLKIDFSLTNRAFSDLAVADVIHELVLQQEDGIFEKAETLEQVDREDYREFNLDYDQTGLSSSVKMNMTVEAFVIYDMENEEQPVHFLLANGKKAFDFK